MTIEMGNPVKLYQHILNSKSALFERGRHEDAHELLSFLIDNCGNRLPAESKSVLEELFGGALQSRIQCGQCGEKSNTQEEMLDLSLNIIESNSLAHALACFFRSEVLDGDNKYQCGR